MPACIVEECKPSSREGEDVILHTFPNEKERIKQWLLSINPNMPNIDERVEEIFSSKTQKHRICSVHFQPCCYLHNPKTGKRRLTATAIPTIFPRRALATEDFSGSLVSPPLKRKRVEGNGQSYVTLKVGDKCPTCRQVFTGARTTSSTGTSEKSTETAEKATYFDRFYGTKSKKVQATVRMFSVKVQCKLLKERKKIIPQSQKSAVFRKNTSTVWTPSTQFTSTTQKSAERLPMVSEISTNQSEIASCSNLQNVSSEFLFQDEHLTLMQCPEISSVMLRQAPDASGLYSSFTTQSSTPHDKESTLHPSLMASSSGSTEGDSNDSLFEDAEEEKTLSENNYEYSAPIFVHPINERKFLVYESCLDALLLKIPCQHRGSCPGKIQRIVKRNCESFISVYVECTLQHFQKVWESQPKINRKPVGNIELSSAVLLSGNTFTKMKQFFYLTNILGISESTYYRYQRNFLFPTIDIQWRRNQERNFEALGRTALCVAGDGQWDSPGNNAKYCIYTLMDVDSQKILNFDIQQLGDGATSVGLEKLACKNALDFLLEKGVNVRILCTDRHLSICKMIKDDYSAITHELDVRHLAKSVGKRLLRASKKKNCSELANWIGPIKNHLWWSFNTCGQNPNLLLEKWNSLLYHVQDVHSWNKDESDYNGCQHAELSIDTQQIRKWLHPKTASYESLKKIVMDNRLQKELKHITHFCHTGDLEVFHSNILKYRSKRQHFGIDGMHARTQLAALDHNENVNRVQALVREASKASGALGSECFNSSKAGKEWLVQAIYEPTHQEFLKNIMREVYELAAGNRSHDWVSERSSVPCNIAPKPIKQEMIEVLIF
ncbi:uncharacterized protein [Dendropsophus ebraccatus]|uniref:uncharacterized protein n=1 Tax=Dendropsophus ebraccatus TaxID=150705 RepID=UPI0038313703